MNPWHKMIQKVSELASTREDYLVESTLLRACTYVIDSKNKQKFPFFCLNLTKIAKNPTLPAKKLKKPIKT
jgi:hypothetical protein